MAWGVRNGAHTPICIGSVIMYYILQTDGTNRELTGTVLAAHPCMGSARRLAVAQYVHLSDGLVDADITYAQMVQQCNAEQMQIVLLHM